MWCCGAVLFIISCVRVRTLNAPIAVPSTYNAAVYKEGHPLGFSLLAQEAAVHEGSRRGSQHDAASTQAIRRRVEAADAAGLLQSLYYDRSLLDDPYPKDPLLDDDFIVDANNYLEDYINASQFVSSGSIPPAQLPSPPKTLPTSTPAPALTSLTVPPASLTVKARSIAQQLVEEERRALARRRLHRALEVEVSTHKQERRRLEEESQAQEHAEKLFAAPASTRNTDYQGNSLVNALRRIPAALARAR